MANITTIVAWEILDSRGNPTVRVRVELSDGAFGVASVPSGASTGEYEAIELRDNDKRRFLGKGALRAVEHIQNVLAPAFLNRALPDQKSIDAQIVSMDGTRDKSKLGANALLGLSLACAQARACSNKRELFADLEGGAGSLLPVPLMNIINGGAHADNNLDIQEFMIVPGGAASFAESLRMGAEIYQHLKKLLHDANLATAVGDEGGFAPSFKSNEEALQWIMRAIETAGYRPGEQCRIALDVAASEFYKDGKYALEGEGVVLDAAGMTDRYAEWARKYPIVSVEDGLDQNDWDGWKHLTQSLGNRLQLVGDDLFVTTASRLKRGIELGAGNSILVKVNQVGTLTETLDAIHMAQSAKFTTIISHRSGETSDTLIADLAVATNAGQIKTGAPARSERVEKYNRLLEIEWRLGARARFAGFSPWAR